MTKERVSRKELLKEPDEFITTTARMIEWLKEYSKWVAAAVIGIIVVGAAVWGWNLHKERGERRAQELQAQAYQLFRSATDQNEEAASRDMLEKAGERFQEVIQEFDGTRAALMARLYHGHTSYALGRYDEAVKDYESVLERAQSQDMKALALQGLGYALMDKGDFERAIETFQKLEKHGGASFQRTAQWNIASCLQKQGKTQEALEIYRELEQSLPDMMQRLMAQARIQELSPEGETSP